jgi:hypothetical protein
VGQSRVCLICHQVMSERREVYYQIKLEWIDRKLHLAPTQFCILLFFSFSKRKFFYISKTQWLFYSGIWSKFPLAHSFLNHFENVYEC